MRPQIIERQGPRQGLGLPSTEELYLIRFAGQEDIMTTAMNRQPKRRACLNYNGQAAMAFAVLRESRRMQARSEATGIGRDW